MNEALKCLSLAAQQLSKTVLLQNQEDLNARTTNNQQAKLILNNQSTC